MQSKMILEQQRNASRIRQQMRGEVLEAHHKGGPDVDHVGREQSWRKQEAFAKSEARTRGSRGQRPLGQSQENNVRPSSAKPDRRGGKGPKLEKSRSEAPRRTSSNVFGEVPRRTSSNASSEAPRRTQSVEVELPPIRGSPAKVYTDAFGRSVLKEPPPPKVHLARASPAWKPDMESYMGESIVTREVTEKLQFLGTPKPIFTHQNAMLPKPHLSSWDEYKVA
mmetsp:Transcript_15319/g.35291  ORF Transcript_15319/g.35291 Transcript_15319/m.35291 type:complete len:223 (-) Transcript_15319:220-888(-)